MRGHKNTFFTTLVVALACALSMVTVNAAPAAADDVITVTYEFYTDDTKPLPPEVLSLVPVTHTAPMGSFLVKPTPLAEETVKVSGGTWQFWLWFPDSYGSVSSDVHFRGKWYYTSDVSYPVTYSFVSGTTDLELPADVLAQLPHDSTIAEGDDAVPPTLGQVTFPIGTGSWQFQGWSPTGTDNVTGPVNFVGTWTFVEEATVEVTAAFVSLTDGKELPPVVTSLVPAPAWAAPGSTVLPPALESTWVSLDDGDWEFVSWTPTTVTAGDVPIEFVGGWRFIEAEPPVLVPITYLFVSGTAAMPTLPPEVLALLPAASTIVAGSNAEEPAAITETVAAAGGVWEFYWWSPPGGYANVHSPAEFEGQWRFHEQLTHEVAATFVSNTSGKELPASVLALAPAPRWVLPGASAPAPTLATTSVVEADGTWTFDGWDSPGVAAADGPVAFVGAWTFTPEAAVDPSPTPGPIPITAPTSTPTATSTPTQPAGATGTLPSTGVDAGLGLLAAVGLMTIGGALTRRKR